MSIKNLNIFFLIICSLLSCSNDENQSDDVTNYTFLFEDGFETENNLIDELFPSDQSRWSNLQQTNPTNAINEISIISTVASEGENALRIIAYESDSQLSKMDIEKGDLNISVGSDVIIKADFFINGNQSLENLLLIDLECCSCWDPNVGDNYGSENQCPGVRLMMSGGNDYLSIERGKISETTLLQTTRPFPRNQWVSVRWEMTLSDENSGINKLYINDEEVINTIGMNMPNAETFSSIFANQGIDFTLQQPIYYERVQIGATANPNAETVELYVDNFSIKIN